MYRSIYKIVLLTLFVLTSLMSYSQVEVKSYKDKVITKNGSLIVGHIVSYDPDETVQIELKNGNVLTFSSQQLKKVIMHSGKSKDQGLPLKTGRIYNETQFSFLTGVSGTGLSIAHNVMYQHNKYLAGGIGIGLDNYYAAPGRDIYPVFANVKYTLMNNYNAPYIGMKAGYGMAFKREDEDIFEAKGGLMLNPYVGLRVGSRGLMFNFFAGLKFQKADYEISRSWETRTEDIFFRRLELGTSIMF